MSYPLPDDATFKPYPHSQVFHDSEKMLFNELTHAFDTSIACRDRVGEDLLRTIRARRGRRRIGSFQPALGQFVFVQTEVMSQFMKKRGVNFFAEDFLVTFSLFPEIVEEQDDLRR